MAKDFSAINTGRVIDQIAEATRKTGQQDTAPAEEIAERQAIRRTQGRKGAKQPRVNLALSSANYDYVRTCARAAGITQISFINDIIDQHRITHPEEYEKAKQLQEELKTIKLPRIAADAVTMVTSSVEQFHGLEAGSLTFPAAVELLMNDYGKKKSAENEDKDE